MLLRQQETDPSTVRGFGKEWQTFSQDRLSKDELTKGWDAYFATFPWHAVGPQARGFDAGCGSGRWATLVAPRVGCLHCVDASEAAVSVARRNLRSFDNVTFEVAPLQKSSIRPASMDFGYSLGVLHHIPDTAGALRACVSFLKPGAPLLVYLYYSFDNRPLWFRAIWRASDILRRVVCRLPHAVKVPLTTAVAAVVYFPLARAARRRERKGRPIHNWPLALYRDRSFYTMRTDALDRLGTRLEKRFTQQEIRSMMEDAGLERIHFQDAEPYWVAVGYAPPQPDE